MIGCIRLEFALFLLVRHYLSFCYRLLCFGFVGYLKVLLQRVVSELPADFGSLETLPVVGELQTIYFALLILQAFDGYTTLVKVVEEHGVPRDACAFVFFK